MNLKFPARRRGGLQGATKTLVRYLRAFAIARFLPLIQRSRVRRLDLGRWVPRVCAVEKQQARSFQLQC